MGLIQYVRMIKSNMNENIHEQKVTRYMKFEGAQIMKRHRIYKIYLEPQLEIWEPDVIRQGLWDRGPTGETRSAKRRELVRQKL